MISIGIMLLISSICNHILLWVHLKQFIFYYIVPHKANNLFSYLWIATVCYVRYFTDWAIKN
jgi:hypothetical protein